MVRERRTLWLLTTAHLSDCEEYRLLLIPLSPAGPFRDRDGSRYIGRMGVCICVRHRELGGLVNVLACPRRPIVIRVPSSTSSLLDQNCSTGGPPITETMQCWWGSTQGRV